MRVELTPDAREQVLEAARWWRANRDSAELFETELTTALDLLAFEPPLAQVVGTIEGKEVRKVRLPRTAYTLYFTIDDDVVTVHALWHGARGSDPPMR